MKTVVNIAAWPRVWIPILTGFGLAPNGTVKINFRTEKPCPNAYVVLMNAAQFRRPGLLSILYSTKRRDTTGGYLPCEWRASLAHPVNATYRTRGTEPDLYFLGVLQDSMGAAERLTGAASFENPGGDHLSVQQLPYPRVMLGVAWIYMGSAVFLALLVLLRRRNRSRLHALLLVALLLKFLVLLLSRNDIMINSHTGDPSMSRQVLWQLLSQVQMVVEVLVFYVIGLGWKVMRSHLRPSEWAFCGTIGFLSFLLGSFEVACEMFASCGTRSYHLTQFILHSLCSLVVIIATNFNIFTLQRQIGEALATPETGAVYAKYRAYCIFRGLFLYFVILPALGNFLFVHVITWNELWVKFFIQECSLWIIYTGVMWLFRPGPKHLRVFELAVVESSDSGSDISAE